MAAKLNRKVYRLTSVDALPYRNQTSKYSTYFRRELQIFSKQLILQINLDNTEGYCGTEKQVVSTIQPRLYSPLGNCLGNVILCENTDSSENKFRMVQFLLPFVPKMM